MLIVCRPATCDNIANQGFGHWHYAHYYYSQVMYREGGEKWEAYRDQIYARLVSEATDDRNGICWNQGYIGDDLHHRHQPDDSATG